MSPIRAGKPRIPSPRATPIAAAIPRPALPHAMGMLASELAATTDLLSHLEPAQWQHPAVPAETTVRDLVVVMILASEQTGRNRRLLGRLRRSRLLPGAMTAARGARRTSTLSTAPSGQLIAELSCWGRKAADAAPWYRRTPARRFRPGMPDGTDADYLFRVVLPREAWLHRAGITEALGRTPSPGAHAPEIIRQAIRDTAEAWTGRAVLVEISGPAGGRWLLGDGPPTATISADPLSYLRQVTGQLDGVHASGDTTVTSRFLTVRIPHPRQPGCQRGQPEVV